MIVILYEFGIKSVENRICLVYVPHTTASLVVNESDGPAVVDDSKKHISNKVPLKNNYLHSEGNSAAQIKNAAFKTPCKRIMYIKIVAG